MTDLIADLNLPGAIDRQDGKCLQCGSKLDSMIPIMDATESRCSNRICNTKITYWMMSRNYSIKHSKNTGEIFEK